MPNVSVAEMLPVMEEILSSGGEVTFTPRGLSMWPMFRTNQDTVTLKKANGPLKKYDVPLYKNQEGKFILHRVIRKNKDGYVMRGDNTLVNEYGITDDMIIGVMTSFKSRGKVYNLNELGYKFYCVLRCNFAFVTLRRIKRKIFSILRNKKTVD